ncbi:MAG: hypothetical protein K6E49_01580 [Lachnospiraceae bacterium]|nr:hypothetical protein [Lachnospiraceae bacterium]
MDGFRERLGTRYDRSQMRSSAYDRGSSEDRYESDRYERSPRRSAPEGISPEALKETVNEAVTRANREQLDVIADFFDEAKADRMESERAIIEALSHGPAEKSSPDRNSAALTMEQPVPITVVDEENAETLARIERIAGQNAEALNESSEILERSLSSVRSNSEILTEIRTRMEQLEGNISRGIADASGASAAPELTVDFSEEKNEIISAVGDNRAILNMIRQDVLNGFAKNENEEDEQEEKPVLLTAEDAANYYNELEEHVHKECVKCYRNVQSALTEQAGEANKGLEKSVAGMRIMVLLSLIFGGLGFLTGLINLLNGMGIISLF